MTDISSQLLNRSNQRKLIRLRTIIMVRWIAIAGQLVALLVAQRLFDLRLELGLCYFVVGVSVIGNLLAMFIFPENKRLSESENLSMILFDQLQLCVLLFLTGGLHNPFSILVVGPVIISASVLRLRSTIIVATITIALVTLMFQYHYPLRTTQGFVMQVPLIFLYGTWFATVISVLFSSLYSRRIVSEMNSMSDALSATQMALSREQKLTDLGGVVAAAAHELGTPLATIKLASAELMEELSDRSELYEDAALIRQQAERCRDILQSMGRAGKDDLQLRHAPLSAVIEEAAEPHLNRGKLVHILYDQSNNEDPNIPTIQRQPEIIHGLRNLIQNAVDFADHNIWIECSWSANQISVRISDDGGGFPSHLFGKIGDPFVRRRRSLRDKEKRPGYKGMGLGLFIAKTLLERSGAELSFANGVRHGHKNTSQSTKTGAIVEVLWARDKIGAKPGSMSGPLGDNPPIMW